MAIISDRYLLTAFAHPSCVRKSLPENDKSIYVNVFCNSFLQIIDSFVPL